MRGQKILLRYLSVLLTDRRLKLLVARVLCVSALALQGCGVEAATAGVTVTPIGYDIASVDPSIAWVDNNQLLFYGQKSNADPKKVSFAPGKIYIWNESTKSAKEYADGTTFCYADGRIQYGYRKWDDAGKSITVRYAGLLGKEVIVGERPPSTSEWRGFNKFSCKSYSPNDYVPPFPKDREYMVLRDGDGYLVLRPRDAKEYYRDPKNIILFREKGATPVTLPITWDERIAHTTVYSEYLRAYVIRPAEFIPSKTPGRDRGWPATEPPIVYILHAASGTVERIVLPKAEAFYSPRPIRHGWIYGAGNFYKVGSFGLYMNRANVITKLDVGSISLIVISPDGCKAAVAINNLYLEAPSPPTSIKIFNFCAKGK